AGRARRVPRAEDRKDRALARAAQGQQVRPARGGRRRAREVRARARRRGRARTSSARGAVPREARRVVRLPAVLPRLGHLRREGRAAEEVLVVSVAAPGGARACADAAVPPATRNRPPRNRRGMSDMESDSFRSAGAGARLAPAAGCRPPRDRMEMSDAESDSPVVADAGGPAAGQPRPRAAGPAASEARRTDAAPSSLELRVREP